MYFVPSFLNKLWQFTGLLPIRQTVDASQQGKGRILRWDFKFYLLSGVILGVMCVLSLREIRHYYHVWKNEEIRQFCVNNTAGHYRFRYPTSFHPSSLSCHSVEEVTFMKILNYLLLTILVALGIIELNLNFENQIKFYNTVENFRRYFDLSE